MRTKWISTVALFTCFAAGSFAEDREVVSSKLNEVTLFFQGAELTHSATVSLEKGTNEVWIGGLSAAIDQSSLKIKTTGGAVISAYEYSVDYLSEKRTVPTVRKLQDSVAFYQKKSQQIEVDTKINRYLIELLQKGTDKNVAGSEKGVSFEELAKILDCYKTKSLELEAIAEINRVNAKDCQETLRRLQAQLDQESRENNKTSGILKLTLTAPIAANSQFTISYFTLSAGWLPSYDINIQSTDRPITLATKAKIRQTTGIDWEKVKLTLSTATPSNGKIAPLFQTWFLDFVQLVTLRNQNTLMKASQNVYSYVPAPSVNPEAVALSEAKISEEASSEYLYFVDNMPVDAETFLAIDPAQIKSKSFLDKKQASESYGEHVAGVWSVSLKSGLDDYVVTADNALNVTYAIDIPYSIRSNGKEQQLELSIQETNASYKYYCAPKLDTETYLLAEIAHPERLNLLNAKANVTYEGTYVGETYLDAASTHTNLTLTLGVDKRVSVKREKMQDFSSRKLTGSEIEQIFTYRLTVRNGQNQPIRMVLKDQYPISSQKEIKVELLKGTTPPTFHNEEMGVLSWEEELNAGETRSYQISYSVKYPKNRTVKL
ncbi:MAG: DUF4139 domain-containing protein [Tannerella sp.]|nr:DUF4139 domain-containing protein [Tannerella sp.]